MSIDVRFSKNITLNDIKEKTDLELEYNEEHDIWIGSKCYGICVDDEQFVQIIIDKELYSEIEDVNEIPISYFTMRGSGCLIIKELSLKFQCSFLTDEYEERLIYLGNETDKWSDVDWNNFINECMANVGLKIDLGKIVEI